MARKFKDVTITGGRDDGKMFRITEKPPIPAEEWGMRALNAMGRALGQQFPEDYLRSGLQGLTVMGIAAAIRSDFFLMKPLLDEMLPCIKIYGAPGKEETIRPIVWDNAAAEEDGEIEDVKTIATLRMEVLELHLDFFPRVKLLILAMIEQWKIASIATSEPTPTSPPPSGQLSARVRRRSKK